MGARARGGGDIIHSLSRGVGVGGPELYSTGESWLSTNKQALKMCLLLDEAV